MAALNRTITVNAVEVVSKTPQVNALVGIIRDAAKDGKLTEAELRDALLKSAAALRTRQDPWLIFAYYRRQLVDAGFIVVDGLRQWVRTAPASYWNYEGV